MIPKAKITISPHILLTYMTISRGSYSYILSCLVVINSDSWRLLKVLVFLMCNSSDQSVKEPSQ